VALGLLLSTVVTSAEAAMALTPIALIPQVVLGGLHGADDDGPAPQVPLYGIPARWGFEGAVQPERAHIANDPEWIMQIAADKVSSPPDFIEAGKFKCAIAQMASPDLPGAWAFTTYETTWLPFAVLGGMTMVELVVLCIILKRRDPV
jgi:hypothetical protein